MSNFTHKDRDKDTIVIQEKVPVDSQEVEKTKTKNRSTVIPKKESNLGP